MLLSVGSHWWSREVLVGWELIHLWDEVVFGGKWQSECLPWASEGKSIQVHYWGSPVSGTLEFSGSKSSQAFSCSHQGDLQLCFSCVCQLITTYSDSLDFTGFTLCFSIYMKMLTLICMICTQVISHSNFSCSIFTIFMSCVTSVPYPCYGHKREVLSPVWENWLSCISFLTLTDLEPERIIVPVF